jgi:hypothetical protein
VVVVLDEMDYLVGKSLRTMEGKVSKAGKGGGKGGVRDKGGRKKEGASCSMPSQLKESL